MQPTPTDEYKQLPSNADGLVHAPAAINAELMECQDVTEILDIVSEEAAIMTGENAALALMRLVNLSKSELHRLRHGPGFHKLLIALEEHIDELGPKVNFYLSPQSTLEGWHAVIVVFQPSILIISCAFTGVGPDFVEPGKGQTQPTQAFAPLGGTCKCSCARLQCARPLHNHLGIWISAIQPRQVTAGRHWSSCTCPHGRVPATGAALRLSVVSF